MAALGPLSVTDTGLRFHGLDVHLALEIAPRLPQLVIGHALMIAPFVFRTMLASRLHVARRQQGR